MRKAGQLDDAEHITNPALQAFRPVTRDLASTLSVKTGGIEKKLKYVDRKPHRKSVFEIAEENIKDPLTRVNRTAHLVTSNITSQIISGAREAVATAAIQRPPQQYRPQTPAETGQWDDKEGRNLRNNLQRLGSGPAPDPTPQEPVPMEDVQFKFIPSAGPMADAIASRNPNRRLRAARALGANSGQGYSRAGRPDGSKRPSLIEKKKVPWKKKVKEEEEEKPPPPFFGPINKDTTIGVKTEASEAVVKEEAEEAPEAGVFMDGRQQVGPEAMEEDDVPDVLVLDREPIVSSSKPGTSKKHAGKPEEIQTVPMAFRVGVAPAPPRRGERAAKAKRMWAKHKKASADDEDTNRHVKRGAKRRKLGPDTGDVEFTGEIDTEERLRRNFENAKANGNYEDLSSPTRRKKDVDPGPVRWSFTDRKNITAHRPIVNAAKAALFVAELSNNLGAQIQEERNKRPPPPPSDDGTIVVDAADSSGTQGSTVSRPEGALPVPGQVDTRPNPALATSVVDAVMTKAVLSKNKKKSTKTKGHVPTTAVDRLVELGTTRRATIIGTESSLNRKSRIAQSRNVNPFAPIREEQDDDMATTVAETELATTVAETELATTVAETMDRSATHAQGNDDQDLTNTDVDKDLTELLTVLGNLVGEGNVKDVTHVFESHASQKLRDSIQALFQTTAGRREAITKIILTNVIHSVLNESTGFELGERIGVHHKDGWVDTMIGAYLTSAAAEGQTQGMVAAENIARLGINLSTCNEDILNNAGGYDPDYRHRVNMANARLSHEKYTPQGDALNEFESYTEARQRLAKNVASDNAWYGMMDSIADNSELENDWTEN